jgi:lipid-A-disaccharide synthase
VNDVRPLRVGIVAGEESGDLLAADLVAALRQQTGRPVELVGVGGRHLATQGLVPLFDGSEIALMGVSAVLRDLPRLIRRIGSTARAIAQARPDCLVTVDSPDFSLRVAAKVKAALPHTPTVHYVCPSVWAWRPGRAPAMKPYVDRILCVLPFEPAELERLGGPEGIYVGHRLARHPGIQAAAAAQAARPNRPQSDTKRLLVLPGSRRSEVGRLAGVFGETVRLLAERGDRLEVLLPTVPHVAAMIEQLTSTWAVKPAILQGEDEKWGAFGEADAALAASGTVTLELALCGVPMISCYRTDPVFGAVIARMITAWSASLPNLVAGWPVVTESYDAQLRADRLARQLQRLWSDSPDRTAHLAGLATVAARMATDRPSGELAADAVLSLIETAGN